MLLGVALTVEGATKERGKGGHWSSQRACSGDSRGCWLAHGAQQSQL